MISSLYIISLTNDISDHIQQAESQDTGRLKKVGKVPLVIFKDSLTWNDLV